MKLSVAKIGDNLPEERDISELEMAPAPAAEVVDTTIGAGLAIEEAQIKNTNHQNTTKLTRVSPVRIRWYPNLRERNGIEAYRYRLFLHSKFVLKVDAMSQAEKNRHVTGASIDQDASTKRPASSSQTMDNSTANGNHVQAEAISSDVCVIILSIQHRYGNPRLST